jgi:uncharacterized protein
LTKDHLYPKDESFRMDDDVLEEYIVQHIEACPGSVIQFSWHGGEPMLLGLEYFRKIVKLQHKHQPPHQRIINGIQTNGTLLDERWCRFLAEEGFVVGISLDGPEALHDQYRVTKGQNPTHKLALQGYELLQRHRIPSNILCVVHAQNVQHPAEVYRFFKQLKARYVEFLPLVEPQPEKEGGVSPRTVPAEAFGNFLCTIFDEWVSQDVEQVNVQIFEEVARTALGQEHALCVFRKTCGDVPVIEHNGDFFSCDHFVDTQHHLGNIRKAPLVGLLESPKQRAFGQAKWDTLPSSCQKCEVLGFCHGGCPKDRILHTPDGKARLNYLCAGYKRFFTHCQRFVTQLSALGHQQSVEQQTHPAQVRHEQPIPKIGRNDPCPCGSGKKYKKCCMGK